MKQLLLKFGSFLETLSFYITILKQNAHDLISLHIMSRLVWVCVFCVCLNPNHEIAPFKVGQLITTGFLEILSFYIFW